MIHKDFSRITKPLNDLLVKDIEFIFNERCHESLQLLKNASISSPIMQAPYWSQPFEIMCDASDYALGVILGLAKIRKCMPYTTPLGPWIKLISTMILSYPKSFPTYSHFIWHMAHNPSIYPHPNIYCKVIHMHLHSQVTPLIQKTLIIFDTRHWIMPRVSLILRD